ncbi:MAG: DUF411 domain-containing protein [Paracoccaceae bacterium]
MDHLAENGFAPEGAALSGRKLVRRNLDPGGPPAMASCHTTTVDGYVIEAHAPAEEIRRLLAERPDAVGL